jgi:hypothetical protein
MPRCPHLVLALLPLLLAGCPRSRGPEDVRNISPDLPIRRVILYQNGVGYFEREGKLDGNLLTLHCRPNQINDLLKSLTVIDRGTGRPISISLPLEKTGAKILSELPKQVRDAAGLLDVLRVFRGARVTVEGRRGSASGRVVGVEQGLLDARAQKPVTGWRLTLKTKGGELLVYPVAAITRLTLDDRALEVGLDKSLDVSLDEGTWKPVKLTVRLAGKDSHDLLVSYIVEMPNWKPAYRLVLHPDRRPLLQGWAVVDNMSGESWKDARLSLVAGTPMSFVFDLHSPRFTRRVDLTPRGVQTALAPTREEAGYTRGDDGAKDRLQKTYARRRSARDARGPAGGKRSEEKSKKKEEDRAPRPVTTESTVRPDEARNIALERQLKTRVEGKKVGSLFRYDLKDPVTVPDSSSTLVNIVNTRVPGGEVVLFRPELTRSYAASHPYRAVRFSNESGFTLEKGPVAIYSRGTFVGEGFLERMEKGSTIFLTFSIDGSVSMTRKHERAQEVLKMLKIARGQIQSEVLHIDRRIYSVTNRHDRPVTAYVKTIAPSSTYELRNPPAQTVTTPAASYVPVTVQPGRSATLKVEWISPTRRWLAVDTSMATTVLKLFSSSGKVPAAIKPTLDKILAAKGRVAEIDAELARISRTKRELSSDQDRVRANLNLLRKVKGNAALRARLTRSLAKLEERLGKLTSRYVKLDEERARLKGTIRALIGEISFDGRRT